ncbi:MAG: hypothetical protein WBB07_17390 [Mycobacterium sp.]
MTAIDFIGPIALVMAGIPMTLCAVARRPKPKPASPLAAAVDKAWSADGKTWRGADFIRPKRGKK